MPCYTPLAGWVEKDTGRLVFKKSEGWREKREVACGQCLGCRLDKSKEWGARIVHESELYDDNCFITLTYRNLDQCDPKQLRKAWHVPLNGSLRKDDFKNFMKRLRKEFTGQKIRYYQCGEYGEQMDRPHHHACLFNFDFSDKQLFDENEGITLFTSEALERIWPFGFSTIGSLTYDSAAYCAQYVTKKITGEQAKDYYMRCDDSGEVFWLEPEYSTMSRGGNLKGSHGIGYGWYQQYKTDVFPSDELPIPGLGVVKKVPRYYTELLKKEDEDEYNALKDKRAAYLKAHMGDFSPAMLKSKYEVARARLNLSRRRLEE